MADSESQLSWSEDQWSKVRRAVLETASKLRVASSFLPLVGPMPSYVTTVPALRMSAHDIAERSRGEAPQRLAVNESEVLTFATISVEVYLRNSEVSDPDLASALSMFCRAAEVIARVEDALVFNGKEDDDKPPKHGDGIVQPEIYRVEGGKREGLLDVGNNDTVQLGNAADAIVTSVVSAIQKLESRGHFGPFACVLGHELFKKATTPTGSLVLPTDRITPFLDGQQVLRSGAIPANSGVVIALAGDAVDLVVATDISVKFMQLTLEPRYVFRVYERITLRVKQQGAVCVLRARRPGTNRA
jgi:uncharacterized linocin/CFP29 family protein